MANALRLIVERSDRPSAVFVLTGQDAVTGRGAGCDVVLDNPVVSGRHGLFRYSDGQYTYTDLESRNGSALERSTEVHPLPAGVSTPLLDGDHLLLGSADAPVRLRVESAARVFTNPPPRERTVLASAPLSDLLAPGGRFGAAPDALVRLAAQTLSADHPDTLARAGLEALRVLFPDADAHSATVFGAGFHAAAGAEMPTGLLTEASEHDAAVQLADSATPLPMTTSIREDGMRAAVVAPLKAHGVAHGALAAWSRRGTASVPAEQLEALGVASALLGLAAQSFGNRQAERDRNRTLEARLRAGGHTEPPVEPIGSHPEFLSAVELVRTVAPATVPVLLRGETGTGKEVLAQCLHAWGPRRSGRFVAFNCAAVPENLLESELFGHVRGAFTGAGRDKPGLFEEADGGTLFLDEIGEMPPPLQAKLLRVLQDGEVRRVGATRAKKVDVRIVSATHRDLRARVQDGRFRQDLMYRLNAVTVHIPPLRERRSDIALLAHALLPRVTERAGKSVSGLAPTALAMLSAYDFPGNVRELENELVRAVALTPPGEPVEGSRFSDSITGSPHAALVPTPSVPIPLRDAVESAERQAVRAALEHSGGNVSAAARTLGLTRPGLYKVMDRLGMRG